MKMVQTQRIRHNRKSLIFTQILAVAAAGILIFLVSALKANQKPQLNTELPPPEIPQPQFFCGYCHILTYPNVVQKSYELWKKGKHNKYGCVECHYPPKRAKGLSQGSGAGTAIEIKHIPKKPPERFSYLQLGGEMVRTRPRIIDASCLTSLCHGKPDDKFKTKKIKFTEKVPFVHQAHLERKNQIEGQQLNCTSCHQHETEKKHFEVSKDSCYLCHFKNVKFNQGRGECNLCHELPKKPIQTSGEKPITHEMLKKAKVACGSCHFDLIQASGGADYEAYFENGELKTTLVLGAGRIKKENCLACHDKVKELKQIGNKKLMHQEHVTKKSARCFDCHQPITHAKADLNQAIRSGCPACHPQPHRYQSLLAEGPKRKGVSKTPDFMHKARANCLGCHVEKKFTARGQIIMKASAKTCVRCHTKDHKKMLEDWKTELVNEIKYTKEVEQDAIEALTESKSRLSKSKLATARKMLAEGQKNINIVQFGNGVHNKKYSIMLLDAAITRFDEMIDFIGEGE